MPSSDPVSSVVNAFTVDVEDYFQVSALASAVSRDSWAQRELRVERNTDAILAMLDERRITGTFFVLGWVAERAPALVRRIDAAGHEVACHGYSHQLIYRQSREEFRAETTRAKKFLEDTLGRPVLGYRAASFSITRDSTWALDTLIDLGFRYDSSVFPVRHDRYGIPGAGTSPGAITAPSGREIVEFPMSTVGILGRRLPISGGGYFRLLPLWMSMLGLRRINRIERQPFTFYIHPWEIDPGQPRVEVGLLSRFRHYTNLSVCEARLRQLLAEFRFTSMARVLTSAGLLGAPTGTAIAATAFAPVSA